MANFDFVSYSYDSLAKLVYRGSIRKAQVHFLDRIEANDRVLVLGGGTGWILEELGNINVNCHVDYVEASINMLNKSKNFDFNQFASLQFIHGTEVSVEGNQYDFIITPFVLDVFPLGEMKLMVKNVFDLLAENGKWLCIDFNCKDTSFKAKALSFLMIIFFRLFSGLNSDSVLDYFGVLNTTGLKEVANASFFGSFIKAVLYKK